MLICIDEGTDDKINMDIEDEIKELRAKLDSAYTRIQEMAIEQSKSAAPRIIESNNK